MADRCSVCLKHPLITLPNRGMGKSTPIQVCKLCDAGALAIARRNENNPQDVDDIYDDYV